MARSPITATKGDITSAAEETLQFDDDNLRAIAEVYKNEGNDEYKKNNFNNAIQFYTEGIKVNCKDEELNAILYSNRAAARFNLGFVPDA
ncbi:Tetratricopeptide repeat protein 4 [Porites harrisoni]